MTITNKLKGDLENGERKTNEKNENKNKTEK
jgi:hypothetical protein